MRSGIDDISEIIGLFSPVCADEKTQSFSTPEIGISPPHGPEIPLEAITLLAQ
jgi:hypothetical protein